MKLNEEILERFRAGFEEAKAAGVPEPTAMSLATADERGRPSVRVVLMKDFDADGFVFYTNTQSRKGDQLAANAAAALTFWWPATEQQVLIEGRASPVAPEEADAYFASRPRGSRIGAWASQQSRELESRQALVDRVRELEAEYEGREIPRPPHWSGYRVEPHRVEFWYGREYRLHERILFTAGDDRWEKKLLYP
jgi:pyridoxamine 5'-phosphate oxidase